eukprot:COSAG01_NODE_17_length_39991_cov_30.596160_49_plen_77_part_00
MEPAGSPVASSTELNCAAASAIVVATSWLLLLAPGVAGRSAAASHGSGSSSPTYPVHNHPVRQLTGAAGDHGIAHM